ENWSKYLAWVGKMLALIPRDVVATLTSEPGRLAFTGAGALIVIGLNVPWKRLPLGHRSRLRLFVGEGDPYVRTGAYPNDPDLIYSIGIEATQGLPVTGISVVVDSCEPPGA